MMLTEPCSLSCLRYLPTQFLQFRMKIINLKLERFGDRVEFSGNPSKYDVSVTLKNVQLEDEGIYNCYVTNPPDRHRGHGKIYLQVLLEGKGMRDTDPSSQLSSRHFMEAGVPCLQVLVLVEGIHAFPLVLREQVNPDHNP